MTRRRGEFEWLQSLWLASAIAMFVHFAAAQSTSAVEGTLVDACGAAVPDAKVTLTNQATQVAYRSVSNSIGVFRVAPLPLGVYRAEIEAKGFRQWVQSGLEL